MEIKLLEYLTLLIGIYMAWNIGANDVANGVSTSVGSKALTLKKAVTIAVIFEFCGAYFLGGDVSSTIQSGIINTTAFEANIYIFVFGMIAALLGTSIWLNVASYLKLPVSTTHAIVGSVIGFGAIIGGIKAVHWGLVSWIALSWLVTPLLSGVIAYLIFKLLQKKIFYSFSPLEAAKRFIPLLVFISLSVFSLSIIYGKITKITTTFSFPIALAASLLFGGIASLVAFFLVRKMKVTSCKIIEHHPIQLIELEKAKRHLERIYLSSKGDTRQRTSNLLEQVNDLIDEYKEKTKYTEQSTEYSLIEKSFGYLQMVSVALMSLGHGSNDVSNAIGPVAAVIQTLTQNKIQFASSIPYWILLIGAFGIVFGIGTWGWRVIETIGHKITSLTPTRGFSAEFGAATTILLASELGMPISTTHALVGAVLGVGLAKGLSALNLRTLKEIVLSWIITIPICSLLCIVIFYILKYLLLRFF
jgi:inorganic phosphate transporter, PiT family